MSDQRHDPPPWSAAPSAAAGWGPYDEEQRDGTGADGGAGNGAGAGAGDTPSGHTQFPPAAGQGDGGYAGPETQLGMALHEESAAAQQTSYLPPVTDTGPYGNAYGGSYGGGGQPGGGSTDIGGHRAPYGGGQDRAGAGQPGGPGAGYGDGSYGDGHSSPAEGRTGAHAAPYGGGQDPAGGGHPSGPGPAYGAGSLGGPGPGYGAGSPGGGGPGGRPAAYPPPHAGDGLGAGAAAGQPHAVPPQAAGAVDETAYLPPVTDDGASGYGGTGAGDHAPHGGPGGGAAVEQTAYLPPVTDHDPAAGDGAQWPDGWERGGTGAGAPATAHPGSAGHPGAPGGHRGSATGHPSAATRHPAPHDPHPDVPSAGRTPTPGPAAAGAPDPGAAAGGFPGPGGPETGTLYGAPAPRRPKPPAEVLREEGTSVLIAPGPQPAALTAVLAALLAVAAALDVRPGLAAAVALLQGVTAAGWFRLNGMWPAREGIALAAAAGLTATGAVLAVDEDDATIAALGSLGGWFLLIALVQLRSTQAPKERLAALNVALTAAALAVLATGYLAAERHAVIVGAVAVAAGTLGRAVPLPPNASPVAAVAAAGAGGLAAGLGTDMGAAGGLLGLAAGVCVLVAVRVASYDYPSRFVHMTAGVSLPLTLSVPAAHLLGLALL